MSIRNYMLAAAVSVTLLSGPAFAQSAVSVSGGPTLADHVNTLQNCNGCAMASQHYYEAKAFIDAQNATPPSGGGETYVPPTEVPATPLTPATPTEGTKVGQIEFRNNIEQRLYTLAFNQLSNGNPIIVVENQVLPRALASLLGLPNGTAISGRITDTGRYAYRVASVN